MWYFSHFLYNIMLSILVSNILVDYWHLTFLFFLISMVYSSVGFGGGSSYLAILSLTEIIFIQVRSTALLCDIIVVTTNLIILHKIGKINWIKVFPLVIFSVPMAFMGGLLRINKTFFLIILSTVLVITSIIMWRSNEIVTNANSEKKSALKNALYGGGIGFLSGLVGIGGGIFLAPFLHIIRWGTSKEIASTCSFFILVNSIGGLIGQTYNPKFQIDWFLSLSLMTTVFVGSIIGNKLSNKLLNPLKLKKATAILIACIGFKILFDSIF